MEGYSKLKVWETSHILTLSIYKFTKDYPEHERFGLISQLRRATSSIPTNIAEGYGQLSISNYIRFLGIARGSALEVQYLLYLSKGLGYMANDAYESLSKETTKVIKMLNGLIKYLKNESCQYKTT